MGSSSKSPPPPDPYKTANAQWDFTKRAIDYSSQINSPNQYTPFGSVEFQRDANGVPISQTVSLNPQDQAALDQRRNLTMGLSGAALNQLGQLPQNQFSLNDIGVKQPGVNDYQDWGNKIAQTSYNQQADLLRPDIEQGRSRLEQTLSDRGLPISGTAYQTAYGNNERQIGNQLNQAAQNATLMAGNEMSRLYGLQSDQYNTALQSKLLERQQPFNELAQYLGTAPQQPYQNAQAITPLNAQASDFQGAQALNYQGQLANYQAQQQQNSGLMGMLGGLGGAILGGPIGGAIGSGISGLFSGGSSGPTYLAANPNQFSSRTLKNPGKPMEPVLEKIAALPVERWEYKFDVGNEHIGTYAEDFKAAFGVGDGMTLSTIDMFGVLFQAVKELAGEVRALKEAR